MSTFGEERQGTARYLQALAQHWPFIIGSIAFAIAAALLYLATAESRYEGNADVLVTPVSADDETFVGIPVIRESGEGRGVLTAARLVKTPQVADAVRENLDLRQSRDELLDSVHVAPQEQSNIVTVTGEADSAESAAAIANGFAEGLIAERTRVFQRELRAVIGRLSNRLADVPSGDRESGEARALADRLGALRGLVGARDPTLQIASLAVAPAEPSWPRTRLSLAVAIFAGLLLGVGVAIALELVNPLVLRDDDVFEQRLPLLARVPRTSARDLQAHLQGGAELPTGVRDAYRLVRVNLSAGTEDGSAPSTILVTSAGRGEGKTTAAVNLALIYARAGQHVVLVDADLRRARLARAFGIQTPRSGFRELLLEEATVDEALTSVGGYEDRLQLLATSPDETYALDLVEPHRVEALVQQLKTHADVVVFDSPPIADVADALPLANAVDAVVLVVRYGRTRRDKLADARLALAQHRVVAAGIVAVTRRRVHVRAEEKSPAAQPVAIAKPARRRERSSARSSSASR